MEQFSVVCCNAVIFEIRGCHSGVAEDSGYEFYVVGCEWLSVGMSPAVFALLVHQDEGSTLSKRR